MEANMAQWGGAIAIVRGSYVSIMECRFGSRGASLNPKPEIRDKATHTQLQWWL